MASTAARLSKKNLYEVLGLKRGASKQAIKEAYYGIAKKCHPDALTNNVKITPKEKEEAEATFKVASQAYDILTDDSKRSEYDLIQDIERKQYQRQGYYTPTGDGFYETPTGQKVAFARNKFRESAVDYDEDPDFYKVYEKSHQYNVYSAEASHFNSFSSKRDFDEKFRGYKYYDGEPGAYYDMKYGRRTGEGYGTVANDARSKLLRYFESNRRVILLLFGMVLGFYMIMKQFRDAEQEYEKRVRQYRTEYYQQNNMPPSWYLDMQKKSARAGPSPAAAAATAATTGQADEEPSKAYTVKFVEPSSKQ